ncbi:MAG: hypothetical protein EOO82_00105 [Oxalobacteraceae bacterium]|nr:MAG: hypothetical protein EOO82_00105 [Oxalobacteraceae bacterium]
MAEDGEVCALLILTSATLACSDREAFNRWYDEVHVRDILTIEEFESCRRYKVARARLYPGVLTQPDHEYAAIYKIRARTEEDLEQAVERLNELGASGISVNASFDNSRTMASFMLPISDEIRSDPTYRHSGTTGN